MRILLLAFLLGLPLLAQDAKAPTVGIAAEISQLVLPGPELKVKVLEDRHDPMVLRIKAVFPHGDAFRYDLVYYGLEPGKYDLREYLERKDASSTADLPAIPVEVRPILVPGLPVEPRVLQPRAVEGPGGYRALLIGIGVLWALGLIWILASRRRKQAVAAASVERPKSLADHLAPRVEKALAGELPTAGMAELERMLLLFWRRRLGLSDMRAAVAMGVLRQHAEAGPLLEQLELWLHRPGTSGEVDVAALLAPYRETSAESFLREVEEAQAS